MTVNGKKLFGAGRGFALANITNPTPLRFGIPQDMSITFKREVKELFGEKQLAADVSSGSLSTTGKITFAQSSARIFSDLIFGNGVTTGSVMEADNELGTVAGSTPYKITVANAANFATDLGVVAVATGIRYTRVAGGSEVAGASYSVSNAGVYTFATGDSGLAFKLSYLYSVSASGVSASLTNQTMGRVGGFTGVMVFPWTNVSNVVEQDVLTLNSCVASDTEISTKMGDYGKPTFGFTAATDVNDTLGSFVFAEAA